MEDANRVYAQESWGLGERGNSKDWTHVGGVTHLKKMGVHTGRGFTISFTIFLVLLSTDRNDLPLGVDEEDGWKYELPTMLVRSSAGR